MDSRRDTRFRHGWYRSPTRFVAYRIGVLATVLMTAVAVGQPAANKPVRNTAKWNLAKADDPAVHGYDPVAYFPDGGGKATRGKKELAYRYEGVTYWFATEKNREAFISDPSKYEPAHGGWCSWAMREGDQVDVDPESFIVKGGRLFLFYKGWLGDTRAKWLKGDHAAEAKAADQQWKKLSGESPRPNEQASDTPKDQGP